MEKIILGIIAVSFLFGAIDYLNNNRFNYGKVFQEGIHNMGPLALSMVGILSLTPIIANLLNSVLIPLSNRIGLDPSIFTSSFIAIDMGGFTLAKELASSDSMVCFSGILMSSILGCTLSFTLPLALGMIKEENIKYLSKGILCGIITLPIALFISGIILKINVQTLFINLVPIIIMAVLIGLGLIYKPKMVNDIFTFIGKGILGLSIIGLILQGVQSIVGIQLMKGLLPLEEALVTVGKIALFLGGAYVMIEFLKRNLRKPLEKLASVARVNSNSVGAFLGSLASAIIIFSTFDDLDDRGKVLCSAFSVGGAYVLGGQLGYVSTVAPSMIGIYIFAKLLSGILAMLLANVIAEKI